MTVPASARRRDEDDVAGIKIEFDFSGERLRLGAPFPRELIAAGRARLAAPEAVGSGRPPFRQ